MRNLAAHHLVGQRRELLLGAQRVQRVHHVLCGVEQCSVEIEQHSLDGPPMFQWSAVAVAR